MLIQLLYVSQPVGPITTTVTSPILKASIANNKFQNVTGVLCQGDGIYMQVLEGERCKVNALYSVIKSDPRNKNVELLLIEDIVQKNIKSGQ